jgi:ketosteroid isomerase-like protein
MSQAEEQLHTLLATYEESLNAADAGRIEQLFTEDGVFMPAGFPTTSGRSAARSAYDAVTRHRMLDAIETAAATGQRQTPARWNS